MENVVVVLVPAQRMYTPRAAKKQKIASRQRRSIVSERSEIKVEVGGFVFIAGV